MKCVLIFMVRRRVQSGAGGDDSASIFVSSVFVRGVCVMSQAALRCVESPSIRASVEFRSSNPAPKITAEFRSDYRGWFRDLCARVWSKKPWAAVIEHTGRKERQVYAWTCETTEPFASVLVALLRSRDGGRVLDCIMDGAEPGWWIDHRSARHRAAQLDQIRDVLSIGH